MSELDQLKKLIKLNGDEDKYSEGLKILNSGSLDAGKNARTVSFCVGGGLALLALTLNPSLLTQATQFIQQPVEPQPSPSTLPLPPQPPQIGQPAMVQQPQPLVYTTN